MGKDGKADVQRYHNLMGKAIDVFTQVQAGPNGELLLTTLGAKGGTAAQLALTQKMMSQLKTFNESVNSFNGAIGEDKGSEILSVTKADDPNLTPAQRDAAFVQADLMVQSLPEDQRQGAWEKVNKARSQANTSWTKPMQDRIEREVSFSYDKNPGTEIAKLEQLKLNGMIDPRSADRQIANYRQLQSADMRPYVNAAKTAVNDILKQETDSMKLPGSEGGAIITERERLFLINRSAELSSSVEVLRRQSMADGSGASGFSSKLGTWVKEQKPQAPKPANPSMQPLMPQGPEAWARSLGLGQLGPGNRAANYQLRQRVDNGAVMPQKEYIKNYDQYIETGRLSDSMKLLIKRSGYGATPSQFFFKQWDKMYPGVKMNPTDVEALKALDQQKISFAQPPAAANPYAQTAMNIQSMIRNASMGAMNAFVPPAAAGDMSYMRGRPATGTQKTGWNSIVTAARAKGAKFPELVAAQWALESDWGRSVSGRNNFFGQKGPGTSKATWEVVNGRRVNTTASFRDFATPGDSVNFLIGKWYKGRGGANSARTVAEAAQILKQQGYATDPEYVSKLLSIVNSNKGS
jgi:flagellum-specific peptidoglycan hydrolase FlgJ